MKMSNSLIRYYKQLFKFSNVSPFRNKAISLRYVCMPVLIRVVRKLRCMILIKENFVKELFYIFIKVYLWKSTKQTWWAFLTPYPLKLTWDISIIDMLLFFLLKDLSFSRVSWKTGASTCLINCSVNFLPGDRIFWSLFDSFESWPWISSFLI